MNRRAIRRSVVAELTSAEVVLSATVFDLSVTADDFDRAVTEFRWLKDYGGFPGTIPESFENVTDEQIKERFRGQKKLQTWDAPDIPLPVLDGVLSAGASGFSAAEVALLSEIRRQVYFLSYRNQVMREYRQLFLTTEVDSDTGRRIRAELDSSLATFRSGAIHALGSIREGLKVLPKPGHRMGSFKQHLTRVRGKLPLWITRFWA